MRTEGMPFQSYYRVLVGPKNVARAREYDVADFVSRRLAESYVKEIVRKHPKWDDDTMCARIVRMRCDDDHLGEAIERIKIERRIQSNYRVYVCLKNHRMTIDDEVACFYDANIAENYIRNVIKRNPDWDEETMFAIALKRPSPPEICTEEELNYKLQRMKTLLAEESRMEQPSK